MLFILRWKCDYCMPIQLLTNTNDMKKSIQFQHKADKSIRMRQDTDKVYSVFLKRCFFFLRILDEFTTRTQYQEALFIRKFLLEHTHTIIKCIHCSKSHVVTMHVVLYRHHQHTHTACFTTITTNYYQQQVFLNARTSHINHLKSHKNVILLVRQKHLLPTSNLSEEEQSNR